MKLSELLASDPVPERVFGVVVDNADQVDPPEGLKEISFVAAASKDVFDHDLMDIVISYLLSKVEVVVEIPAESEIPDPDYLLAVASSVGISVAFLPPQDLGDEAFEAYCKRMETFVQIYCGQANYAKSLMPVTSYLEYLMIEMLNPTYAATFVPTDEYVVNRFASVMSTDRSDAMKARMRAAFETYYGGADVFRAHCMAQFQGLADEAEAILVNNIEVWKSEQAKAAAEASTDAVAPKVDTDASDTPV